LDQLLVIFFSNTAMITYSMWNYGTAVIKLVGVLALQLLVQRNSLL